MTSSFAYLVRTSSPLGRLELTGDGTAVTSLSIETEARLPLDNHAERSDGVLRDAISQLAEYFAGDRRNFDVPIHANGSDFQRTVWRRLALVGWGEFTSYGELASALDKPGSARAIGGAVATNPTPILVGCHRVLSSTGSVTGYSPGAGVPTKLWLLEHEGITLAA